MHGFGPSENIRAIISPVIPWVLWIRFPLLILAVMQLTTCGLIITGNPSQIQQLGIKIYIGTISIQEVLVLYLLGSVWFYYSTMTKNTQQLDSGWPQWRIITMSLFLSLSAIFLRIAYRMVELFQVFQAESILAHNEVLFYSFEAVPTIISLLVWVFVDIENISQTRKDGHRYWGINGYVEEAIPIMIH